MKSKKNCPHSIRTGGELYYFHSTNMCVLPMAKVTCLACDAEWMMDSSRGQLVPHPSEGSMKMINHFQSLAEAERKRLESPIITKEEPKLILPS